MSKTIIHLLWIYLLPVSVFIYGFFLILCDIITNHKSCANDQAITAISLRRRNFSTSRIMGIWTGCMMNGMAARTPIWKLLAPNTRAKATRKPLVVILLKPMEVIPSHVIVRSPRVTSSSDKVGLGWKIFQMLMYYLQRWASSVPHAVWQLLAVMPLLPSVTGLKTSYESLPL